MGLLLIYVWVTISAIGVYTYKDLIELTTSWWRQVISYIVVFIAAIPMMIAGLAIGVCEWISGVEIVDENEE